MLRVRFRLNELRCLEPLANSGDEVFAMFSGASGENLRVVRVQPQRLIAGRYGWQMTRNGSVAPSLVIEQVTLSDFASAHFCFVLAARTGGTYRDALATASELADFFASPAAQSPLGSILFQLPDEIGTGDKVLGSFIIAMMSMGDEWEGSYYYGRHTQPPTKSVVQRLKQAWAGKQDTPGIKRTHYECRGNGGRYLVDFTIESEVVAEETPI